MEYNIYIKNNHKIYHIFNIIITMIFDILNIKYNYINNYDDKVDIIINTNNKIDYKRLNDKKIISNCFHKSYTLMSKNLLNNFNITPYNFEIKFKDVDYDKKMMKTMINKYVNYSNNNMGNEIWILKNNNSGQGIGTILCTSSQLLELDNNKEFIKERSTFKENTIYTIQKYLEKPYLYKNRKCDVRVYIVVFYYKGKYKFFLYNKIILKYTSKEYDLNNLDKYIHLTNNTLQEDYLFKYLDKLVDESIYNKIYDDIKNKLKLQMQNKYFKDFFKDNKLKYVYEIFGVDFLLDKDYNTYLIDFNTTIGFFYIALYEYTNIIKNKNKYVFDMIFMIMLKILKIYNKDKKFITEENNDRYKKLCKISNFKNNFNLLLKL